MSAVLIYGRAATGELTGVAWGIGTARMVFLMCMLTFMICMRGGRIRCTPCATAEFFLPLMALQAGVIRAVTWRSLNTIASAIHKLTLQKLQVVHRITEHHY